MFDFSDTHPQIEKVQFDLIRGATSWRKAHLFGQMHLTMKQLAYAGLRNRFPEANEEDLRRRLADVLLGKGLASRVYGPPHWE